MRKYPNGFLIQDTSWHSDNVKTFSYKGIDAYGNEPLRFIGTRQCREISNRITSLKVGENEYVMREFISNKDDLDEYIRICRELSIPIRILFLESDYCDEIWKAPLPQMRFIGYEYCPVPIDCQIITDLDWCSQLEKHKLKLNEYGLFRTEEDAASFQKDYLKAEAEGYVGDGGVDAYIFKISVVDIADL